MYRSKDRDFMEGIKVSVLEATKGHDKEDRKYAINYLRTHVKIDDLYELAKKKFPGKIFEFGSGSYNPKVVVVTKDPISDDHKEKLALAWRKLKVPEQDVYYTHLRFVKTKKKQEDRQDLLNKLVNILSPTLTVVFDDLTLDVKMETYEVGDDIGILTNPDKKDARRELTNRLRDYKKDSVI